MFISIFFYLYFIQMKLRKVSNEEKNESVVKMEHVWSSAHEVNISLLNLTYIWMNEWSSLWGEAVKPSDMFHFSELRRSELKLIFIL